MNRERDTFRYSNERTNRGHYCERRTPTKTSTDDLPLYRQYVLEEADEAMAVQDKELNRKTGCQGN